MNKKSETVVARLTLRHRDGSQTIIEIHSNATFSCFYRWYARGKGQRVKSPVRTSGRSDATDLAALGERVKAQFERLAANRQSRQAAQWAGRVVESIRIVILKKRAYSRLLGLSADLLPGGLAHSSAGYSPLPSWEQNLRIGAGLRPNNTRKNPYLRR